MLVKDGPRAGEEPTHGRFAHGAERNPPQQNLGSQPIQPQKKSSAGHTALTIVGVALCVVLLPILIVNCTLLVKGATNPDKVPSLGGVVPFIVLSDSMYPQIQSGDLIVCREADASAVKEGDVISFFDPESTGTAVVTHRVQSVSTADDGTLEFVTKGGHVHADHPGPRAVRRLPHHPSHSL